MKDSCLVLTLVTFITLVDSWMAFSPNPENYTGPGCYNKDYGELSLSQEIQPNGVCMVIVCERGGLSYRGCSSVDIDDENCSVMPGNLSKPYPKCCYEIKCRDEL
ncbi:Single domain von Willebrand factor type C [Popillia japonica]|uniref:Single domain von Willebrand factor type C n=1 Tax=Popillia japonica TaxID=7064 RepID=A0AAW1JZJ2_POPJA